MPADTAVRILVGVVLLVLGRKLFWVFVGAAGFVAGLNFAERILTGIQPWAVLVVALIAAIIGAVLAIFLQKLMIAIAGFFIGGYLILELMRVMNFAAPQQWIWIVYIVGGVIGALLVLALFDWALILLSSFAGAVLITNSLHVDHSVAAILFVALLLIGILIQAALMRRVRAAV